jgi:PKD repeat protein
MVGRARRSIARTLSLVLVLVVAGTGTAQALIDTSQPQLTFNRLIRTSPFPGTSTTVRDNEGSAYVASGDAFWMASDNDDALFELDRATGALRRKLAQSSFVNAPRFGVGGSAGQDRTEDLEAIAYDANADVLYAFSGSTGGIPTAFRLVRDGNGAFQVESWQPMPTEWTGAGWRSADGLLYLANGSTIRTYDFATNTLGPSFSISGLSGIFGVDFDDATGDLIAVNGSERLYRASMTTRTLRPGWNGIPLSSFGFLDTRAVEVIGEQLFVTDGADSSARPVTDPMSHAIVVLDVTGPAGPSPTASFTATPTSGTVPLTVSFTDTSTGSPTSWSWNFGDGGTSTDRSPTHTYTSAGTFTATLTASNTQGQSTATRTITVTQPAAPTASFVATPTAGSAPLTVSFTDTSTGSPTSWSWDFGDGGTSTLRSPTHTYTSSGTFTATLTAANPQGSTTASREITVSSTVVVSPTDDAQVNPTGSQVPGSAPSFSVDGSPVKNGLLRFDVDVAGQIVSAKLRLFCVNSSSVGGTFFAAAETNPPWNEETVTWATAPVAGASYGSLGRVRTNEWFEVDLTALVTTNGSYSIRITNPSGNGADYATKEGAAGTAPQLVITTAS